MFELLSITSAFAQQASGQPAQPSAGLFNMVIPLVLMFGVFYFLMIRPQQKKAKQHQQLLAALKYGDSVITASGILGTIAGLTDKFVTLEIADNCKIKVLRSQVSGLASETETPTKK